jgi:hypothetical protein
METSISRLTLHGRRFAAYRVHITGKEAAMSTDSLPATPSIWDWAAWMKAITMTSKAFEQPILPNWFDINITEQNSSDPDAERTIVASQSYGRQIGRMMDAVALLIEHLPEQDRQAEAFREFAEVRTEIKGIKEKIAARRLSRIAVDLATLKKSKREEYDSIAAKLRALLSDGSP